MQRAKTFHKAAVVREGRVDVPVKETAKAVDLAVAGLEVKEAHKAVADLAMDDPAGKVEADLEVKAVVDLVEADPEVKVAKAGVDLAADDPVVRVVDALEVKVAKAVVAVRYLSLDSFCPNYFFAPARIQFFMVSISCVLNIGPLGGMGSFLSVRRSIRRLRSGFFLSTTVERL